MTTLFQITLEALPHIVTFQYSFDVRPRDSARGAQNFCLAGHARGTFTTTISSGFVKMNKRGLFFGFDEATQYLDQKPRNLPRGLRGGGRDNDRFIEVASRFDSSKAPRQAALRRGSASVTTRTEQR